MSSEISVTPFIIAFDVVDKAIDFNAFLDYLKNDHKKDITIINGADYADSSRGTSKQTLRSSRLGIYDSASPIIKGIKSKIETDLAKLDVTKKKMMQSEKSKLSSHRSKSRVSHEPPRFEGKIDMLYIILNYPYLPNQLFAMKENGICINTFFTIKPNRDVPLSSFVNQPKLSAKSISKRQSIPGSEYDFTLNPSAYPPARIVSLQGSAPYDVSFVEIYPGENFESTFKIIESEILKILNIKKDFDTFIKSHNFKQIPSFNPSVDTQVIKDYLFFHPNDIANSIYFQLKEGNWKRLDPPPPETKTQHFDNIFLEMSAQTNRKVVFIEPKEPPDPVFETNSSTFSIHEYLYPLFHWEINEENAYSSPEVLSFITPMNQLYCYAGTKFDTIVTTINKKYSLGLPLTFFDWEQWSLGIDYLNITETLSEAIENASLVETLFDKQSGIQWILVLNPIPRISGQFLSNYSMPFCLQNITEYMTQVQPANDNDGDGNHPKKHRNPPAPAQIIKERLDFDLVLPSIESRIQNSKICYPLPLKVCSSCSFTAPYCFENGLYVQIIRDLVSKKPSFSYKFLYKDIIQAVTTSDSIVFHPVEGIRYSYDYGQALTVFFNDQTLCFDGENLNMMSTNEKNIIITKSGCLVFTDRHGINIIVYPNGSISRYIGEKWITVDKDGISLDGVNRPHSSYSDTQTQSIHMVRSDNIEYSVYQGGKRLLVVDLDCTVEQNDTDNTVTFVVPDFPIIQWFKDKITFDIDRFNFVLNIANFENDENDQNLKFSSTVKTDGYLIKTNGKFATFSTDDCESYLSANFCQFRIKSKNDDSENNDQFLFADSNGNEKVCRLATEEQKNKKKVELFESKWGTLIATKESIQEPLHSNLYRLFLPRFFGVRQNMSGIEFVRKDTVKMDGFKQNNFMFRHPNGENIPILTLHSMEAIPSLFIHFEGLSKPHRANVMKDLRIPKPSANSNSVKKKNSIPIESVIENSKSRLMLYLSDCTLLSNALVEQLAILQSYFIEENQPPEEIEEPPLISPVKAPNPRVLNMMYNLHRPKAPGKWKKGEETQIINYWECTESDFRYPIDTSNCQCKMLSPRLSLFDPPRNYKPEKPEKSVADDDEAFVTQTERPVNRQNDAKEKSKKVKKQRILKTKKDCIDFGEVPPNKMAFATLSIQNTGEKPIHFSFSQDDFNRSFRICSIPGVIFPGLRVTIRVELLPSSPKQVDEFFTFLTPFFEMEIPVKARIVSSSF